MATSTATASGSSIPLGTINPSPASNSASPASTSATGAINNATPSSSNAPAAATPTPSSSMPAPQSQQSQLSTNPFSNSSSYTNTSSTSSRRSRLNEALSMGNGIGTLALVAAIIFGIGAWVGMKIQISQGGKNMDLAIWTACADHEAIQHTKLCKTMLDKDFSQFGKRRIPDDDVSSMDSVAVVVKRGVEDDDALVLDSASSEPAQTVPRETSRIEKLLAKVSWSDQSHINIQPDYNHDMRNQPDPALRATVFPLVNLLIKPISWIFEFIEYMFLVLIYGVHKVFSWLTTAVVFLLQAWIYGLFESVFKVLLRTIDQAILEILPSWIPQLFVSDVASVLCLTGVRSYWYSTSYLSSLKWIGIFRGCMWAVIAGVQGLIALWQAMKSPDAPQTQRENPFLPAGQSWLNRNTSPKPEVSTSTSSALPPPRSISTVRSLVPASPPQSSAVDAIGEDISPEEYFYRQFENKRSRSRTPQPVRAQY